ncbi:MAG: hypothetical protein IB618_04125 [Candidatus Pacearchaeota archaeon]|nr:MAG: hypothetical protein IB618_04125 [Candidatus Pacearchaeota archaeon]
MSQKSSSNSQQVKTTKTSFNLGQLDKEQNLKRKELILDIEKQLKGKVIIYFANFTHPFGIISGEDIMLFEETLASIGKTERLFLIINSPGGYPDAAEKMIMLCRARCKKFYVVVPNEAKSAATMISLGADEIWMSHISELGPIDPIITHNQNNFQAWAYLSGFNSIKGEIIESKNPLLIQMYLPLLNKIDPTILDICLRTTYDAKKFAEKWLKKHMLKRNQKQAEKTAEILSSADKYLTHTKVIDYKEARRHLKLKVKYIRKETRLWKNIWELYVRAQKHITDQNLTKMVGSSSIEIGQSVSVKKIEKS